MKFVCERTAVAEVSKWLAANGWSVVTSEIGYVPKQFPELTEADIRTLVKGATADERALAARKLCVNMDSVDLSGEDRELAADILRVMAADAAERVRAAIAETSGDAAPLPDGRRGRGTRGRRWCHQSLRRTRGPQPWGALYGGCSARFWWEHRLLPSDCAVAWDRVDFL